MAGHDDQRTRTIQGDADAPIAVDADSLASGTQIGRYRIEIPVGSGGMAMVYRAHDPKLGRPVAIKVMLNERGRGTDPIRRARMLREARAAGSVAHPHVVTLYDVGVHDDLVYIAMELLPESLASWLDASPRPWRQVVARFAAAGRGLEAAHEAGLVHRDFKPSNVLLASDGRVKVADFGLACPVIEVSTDGDDTPTQPSTSRLTHLGAWVGTPAFVSPEQFAGNEMDARSDQFSFCVALYHGLYGFAPFPGDTVAERQAAISRDAPRPPPTNTDVPRWIWRVLARGMQHEPSARWPSMDALVGRLQGGREHAVVPWVGLASVATLLVVAVVPDAEPLACTGGPQQLEAVWGQPQRDRFIDQRTDASGAVARAWRRAGGHLDAYANQWAQTYEHVCNQAPESDADANETTRDAMLTCLIGQLDDVDALVRASTPGTSSSAVETARAARLLPRPNACTDLQYARTRMHIPQDAPSRLEARSLHVALADVAALRQAGHFREAFAELEPLLARADALAFAPITARAYLERGQLELEMAMAPAAVQGLEVAYFAANEAGDDKRQIDAAVQLISAHAGPLGDHEGAQRWGRLALAAVTPLGDTPRVGDVKAAIGDALRIAGDREEALMWATQALAARERLLPPDDLRIAESYRSLGVIHLRLGRHDEALENLELAIELQRTQLGDDHPEVARTLNALGIFANESGRAGQDVAYYREAIEITERVYGEDHPKMAPLLQNLANAVMGTDQAQANRLMLRALELRQRAYGEDNPTLAGLHRATANSFFARRMLDEAQHHYERAMALHEAGGKGVHAGLLHELANVAWMRGEHDVALEMSQRAVALGKAQERNPVMLARLELSAAQLQWDAGGDPVEAMSLGTNARFVLAEAGHDHQVSRIDQWIDDPGPPGARLGPRP